MALKVGELYATLGLDDKEYNSKLNAAGGKLRELGASLASLGTKLTLGLTLPLAAAGGAAIKFGMDAIESENLFNVAMGGMAAKARKWSVDISNSLGLNEYEVRKNVGTLNTMLKSMGMGENAALDMSEGMTQLAYDLASFRNLSNEEAFDKIRAGITGETEPLKAIGIILMDSTVKQYAYAHGIAKAGEELTEQQKIMARYGALMEQTGDAQGDLARTMDSPANQARRTVNKLIALATAFGIAMLPILTALLPIVQKVSEWFEQLSPGIKTVVIVALALAAAMGPLITGFGGLITAIMGIVAAPEIAAVIAAIVAALGQFVVMAVGTGMALKYAYDHSKEFRKAVNDLWSTIKTSFGQIMDAGKKLWVALQPLWNSIKDIAAKNAGTVFKIWSAEIRILIFYIKNMADTLTMVLGILTAIANLFAGKLGISATLFGSIVDAAIAGVQKGKNAYAEMAEAAKIAADQAEQASEAEAQAVLDKVQEQIDAYNDLIQKRRDAIGFTSLTSLWQNAMVAGARSSFDANNTKMQLTKENLPQAKELQEMNNSMKRQERTQSDLLQLTRERLGVFANA